MTLEIPTLKDIFTRNLSNLISIYNTGKSADEQINPALRNNLEYAFLYAFTQESNSNYKKINFSLKQLFINSSEDEFLDTLANEIGVTRNPAVVSTGNIVVIGNTGISIPLGTNFSNSEGDIYTSTALTSTSTLNNSITSLTRSGSVVTATTLSEHNLAIGMEITIAGAVETDYNGTFTITSISANNQFTYTITTNPSSPATGTIIASYDGALVSIQSEDTGSSTELSSGSQLTFSTAIPSIETTTYVTFDGIEGGADEETDEDFRTRALEKKQNPASPFSEDDIKQTIKAITGNTRVWVEDATPSAGQVTIYFVRDNDTSIIPNSTEVATAETSVIAIKTAQTSESDIFVNAPTPVTIDITFSSLSPNDTIMQNAITLSLQTYFTGENEVGEDLTLQELNNIIYRTIDNQGRSPTSFTLSAPAGTTTINAGEIAILGTITF